MSFSIQIRWHDNILNKEEKRPTFFLQIALDDVLWISDAIEEETDCCIKAGIF